MKIGGAVLMRGITEVMAQPTFGNSDTLRKGPPKKLLCEGESDYEYKVLYPWSDSPSCLFLYTLFCIGMKECSFCRIGMKECSFCRIGMKECSFCRIGRNKKLDRIWRGICIYLIFVTGRFHEDGLPMISRSGLLKVRSHTVIQLKT